MEEWDLIEIMVKRVNFDAAIWVNNVAIACVIEMKRLHRVHDSYIMCAMGVFMGFF